MRVFVVADGGFVENVGTSNRVNGTHPLAVFLLVALGAELSGGDVFGVEHFAVGGLHVARREGIVIPRHGVEGDVFVGSQPRALRFGQKKYGGDKRKSGERSAEDEESNRFVHRWLVRFQ